jgi:hypothetical protein
VHGCAKRARERGDPYGAMPEGFRHSVNSRRVSRCTLPVASIP